MESCLITKKPSERILTQKEKHKRMKDGVIWGRERQRKLDEMEGRIEQIEEDDNVAEMEGIKEQIEKDNKVAEMDGIELNQMRAFLD